MRKRTISHLSDTIFWYIIYLLPVFAYLLAVYRDGSAAVSFSAFFDKFGIPFLSDVVNSALTSIFGADGILPLYGATVVIPVFSWYISTMIIHLAVDFLLFIPRLAHKFMNKFTCED